jgi:hypothetical protein
MDLHEDQDHTKPVRPGGAPGLPGLVPVTAVQLHLGFSPRAQPRTVSGSVEESKTGR